MSYRITFIGHDNIGARTIFENIVYAYPDSVFQVAITNGIYYKRSFFSSVLKLLKEASFFFCLNRFIEMKLYMLRGDTLKNFCKNHNITFYETYDVNDAKSLSRIKEFAPDIILSTFTMHIIKKDLIKLSKIASIGCHPSILPNYRGLETFFWMLSNDEKNCGASVFLLNEKIDSGQVIMQTDFSISSNETVESLYEKLTQEISTLLCETISRFLKEENFSEIPQIGEGSYFPMPTTKAYKKFKQSGKKWK